ncbi:hypothetical protein JO84_gp243 [Aureococcus anophagefferens virus]|uniref:Uncharacterized protein n=1 Tax=Aureococcus anophagefferens virus TaxID=1474867 RepID=A0A076FHZ2_9VIRU|nr:hypothetical protein JO84_gp243 [Aureococcus anophagefferens virus]AII17061.1 hypothetical protein AaV_232 [Aureococcus anophagefferens virus]UOG94146.1 hypothetical protein MKD35_105 [Aureococcus anophagefferens virus]
MYVLLIMASIYDNQIIDARMLEKKTRQNHLQNSNTVLPKTLQKDFGTSFQSSFNNDDNFISSLSGQKILKEDFSHANMTPFFGSKVTQNVDVNRTQGLLDRHTGVSNLDKPKNEVSPFFENTKDNVFKNRFDYENRGRFNPSQYQQGVPLKEPIRVGPGLAQGFTAAPSGGFQQPDARKYAMKKGVECLRTKNNPKITYEGRHVDGLKGSRRGLQASVKQNCNIRVYDWDDQKLNPVADSKEAMVRVQHVNTVSKLGAKNTNYFGTQFNEVTGLTKKLVDKVRQTIKHETLFEFIGYVHDKDKQVPSYDPNDITKTTRRETTENNQSNGVVGNNDNNTSYVKNKDIAKTTERQIHTRDYTGIAGSEQNMKFTNYNDIYNATLNDLKEGISKGREPTKTSVKVGGIASQIGDVELCEERENTYVAPVHKSIDYTLDATNLNQVDNKNVYDVTIAERLDPDINDNLRTNPYEKIIEDIAKEEDNYREFEVEHKLFENNVRETVNCDC